MMAVLAGESLHGYVIAQRLGSLALFHGQPPDTTGVYRLLRNMESRGLVSAEWAPPADGPARRRYTLTAAGRACLRRWIDTLQGYAVGINDLVGAAARAAMAGRAPSKHRTPRPKRRKACPKAKA